MKLNMNLSLLILVLIISSCSHKNEFLVHSPDKNIELKVGLKTGENKLNDENQLVFSIFSNGIEIVKEASFGLEFEGMEPFGRGIKVVKEQFNQHDENWQRVWGRSKNVRDHYNELVLTLEETQSPKRTLNVYFRIFDDGFAFRYLIPEQDQISTINISNELTSFSFSENHDVWATKYVGSVSDQESEFIQKKLSDITPSHLPLVAKVANNKWIALTEANLADWAGMHFVADSTKANKVDIVLEQRKDNPKVAVKTSAPALSPWRVIMIADSPGSFLESNIIHNLSEPCAIDDVSWIKPGKSAWDWWWCNRYAPDVDFKLGSNTKTMKYFIDFASEMNWEYQLIDWQWYGEPFACTDPWISNPDGDILTSTSKIDIPELVEYANSKNVKLLLWLEWNHTDKQMEEAFPLYEKWGIAGVKIDFMAAEDQEMVNFYHRVAKLAAKHHLVVDFHGAYKPAGLSRTYPNLITREGVLGNEYTKWSDRITPEHTVTVAFTRGILGVMDFTPGAFVNVTKENFKIEDDAPSPMAMGTRCNQLAMMVVFESALQVLCDVPYNYRKSPHGLDFLKIVPTTWDETKVLNEEMANYITVARKAGSEWYVGSMTDWDERELDISMDFLGEGKYIATIWKDGEDANENPVSLIKEEIELDNSTILKAKLAKGGGHVIHIRRKK